MTSCFYFYGNWHSGHSYKVSLFASLVNMDYDYQHIDTFCDASDRPCEFLKVSRHAEVPVIKWDDLWLCQSNSILTFLAKKTRMLYTRSLAKRLLINEWQMWEMSRLSYALGNLRIITKYNTDSLEMKNYFHTKSIQAIGELNKHLTSRDYLCANTLTIADISCSAYLFLADEANLNLKDWPAVNNWLNRIAEQPGWKHPYDLVPHH